ncbi:MAG: hypothetical protein KGI45_00240 [Patescibacteria group bacterium]|nr:hypothetical protein [Patescibacteria group bacterium]
MTSTVIINVDSKIKEQAMKRAKSEGIPLSAVLKLSLRAYAEKRFNVDVSEEEHFNDRTRRQIERAINDFKKGKNISPAFTSVAQMKKWLDN